MSSNAARKKTSPKIAAEVGLYGAWDVGFAFIAARPAPASAIIATGGWSSRAKRPSGELVSLTQAIRAAKQSLQEAGIRRGKALVSFPDGQYCALTPIGSFETADHMKLMPSLSVPLTEEAIDRAVHAIAHEHRSSASRRARRKREALGVTASGKPVLAVPRELGPLEQVASKAVLAHGLLSDEASPAIFAVRASLHKHFASYADEFTAKDHRDAQKLVADDKWTRRDEIDRYLRYAYNGIESLHRDAAELAEKKAREEAWRR